MIVHPTLWIERKSIFEIFGARRSPIYNVSQVTPSSIAANKCGVDIIDQEVSSMSGIQDTTYHIVARALGLVRARAKVSCIQRPSAYASKGILLVYKIPYRRAPRLAYRLHRPLGRVRRASKGILHTSILHTTC